ncbi:Clavaminate synthase-like protein, partial [Aureobasidium melanogenum]
MVNSPRYINLYSSFLSKSGHVLLWRDVNLLTIGSACELETKASIYLAQASLSDLPSSLLEDLPTPELVSKAGKGDVYDTSIWLGQAPTYTPLHRDPNPNLFVQLAGKKQVRLFKPDLGNAIFHHVQASIGGAANATMRGAEMMEGAERAALEQAVWHPSSGAFWASEGLQCELGPGDGLFIPKGWWHSIKGVGQGMIGSVNWWFR